MRTANGLDFNVGDKIIMEKSNNGTTWAEKQILTISSIKSGCCICLSENKKTVIVYFNDPADKVIFADRKTQAVVVRNKIESLTEEINKLNKELDILVKYDSEEDYVADKLLKLIETKDKDKMVKLLKELKTTHYL